ncbi:MAG: hypothetical protein WEB88_05690 [Gemmatimonadota bacterium]
MIRAGVLALVFAVAGGSAEAQVPELAVAPVPDARFRPRLAIGPVLADSSLQAAARGGLPLRIRVRVELWQDKFLDDLRAEHVLDYTVTFDPMGERYILRRPEGLAAFGSWEALRAVVETVTVLRMAPTGEGRFYYTATLEVETLSASDLDELQEWLQGELRPAVSGERSIASAVGQGAKRLFIRLLDLPARRVEVRSGRFRVPPA